MVTSWIWTYLEILLQQFWPVIAGVLLLGVLLIFAAISADD